MVNNIPENYPELEAAVLGAIMISNESLLEVVDVLDADCFYSNANRIIYEKAIIPMFNENVKMNALTIHNRLDKSGLVDKVGGAFYVSKLTSEVFSSASIVEHAYILKAAAIKRQIGILGGIMYTKSQKKELDALDLLDEIASAVNDIGLKVTTQPFSRVAPIITENIERMEHMATLTSDITGVPSGFTEIDRLVHGYQPSDFIILAARPSMGKTTLGLNILENAAIKYKRVVALFSIEVSRNKIVDKLMSSQSGVPLNNIMYGNMSESDWRAIDELTPLIESNILIDDKGGISIFELVTKARKLKYDNPDLAMIIIDYLQLITMGSVKKGTREQEVSYISGQLKSLAKELSIPVMALSQLSRAVESRADKIPLLSDLRESGSLEQDADVIQFIHRPEYYGIVKDEAGNCLLGKAKLITAKHRNGELGESKLTCRFDLSRFENEEMPQLY